MLESANNGDTPDLRYRNKRAPTHSLSATCTRLVIALILHLPFLASYTPLAEFWETLLRRGFASVTWQVAHFVRTGHTEDAQTVSCRLRRSNVLRVRSAGQRTGVVSLR
jgi:hypothetical protein